MKQKVPIFCLMPGWRCVGIKGCEAGTGGCGPTAGVKGGRTSLNKLFSMTTLITEAVAATGGAAGMGWPLLAMALRQA